MNRLVVASFILLSALNLASASPCATPELQSNFDLTAYLGKWYQIERNDNVRDIISQCNKANYTILLDREKSFYQEFTWIDPLNWIEDGASRC